MTTHPHNTPLSHTHHNPPLSPTLITHPSHPPTLITYTPTPITHSYTYSPTLSHTSHAPSFSSPSSQPTLSPILTTHPLAHPHNPPSSRPTLLSTIQVTAPTVVETALTAKNPFENNNPKSQPYPLSLKRKKSIPRVSIRRDILPEAMAMVITSRRSYKKKPRDRKVEDVSYYPIDIPTDIHLLSS